jgi:5-methyltetrahydropteroyltriglutamate--homocysteine methyltransferase
MLFPVTLVGSYPQPDWLIDRARLESQSPPRVRARELWRIPETLLGEAQRDATLIAIRTQEDAGLDIITDGEIRRESYSNRFATALEGIDVDNPGTVLNRRGVASLVPRIVGRIRRGRPVEVEDMRFLRAHTRRLAKITLPGPFTLTQLSQNDDYPDEDRAAMDFAAAVNAEVRDLFSAGADIVQLDEPYLQAHPDKARQYGVKALNRALDGITGTTVVHLCFGYAAMLKQAKPSGYSFLPELRECRCRQISIEIAQPNLDCAVLSKLDLGDMNVETPETVAARIRKALPYVKAEDIIVAPDCGMKYLPRHVAFGKMRAMVEGAKIMRAELGGA